ncbi:MAG: hypothetical protein ACM3Q2_12300 [Syntrophothermus sp.]
MGGKASLYMILGFSLIFMIAGYNYGLLTSNTIDNDIKYYNETVAHNIATSGINLAAHQIFINQSWRAGYSDLAYSGGKINVTVTANADGLRLISEGEYAGATRKIEVQLAPSSFAKFAYYMNLFPGNFSFATGDTVTGPFHTQGQLSVEGNPVFQGKATAKNGLKLANKNSKPKFLGGFESGVNIPITWDVSRTRTAAESGGKVFNGDHAGKVDVRLKFNADATVTYSYSYDGGAWTPDSTKPVTALAPNGVIYVAKGNLYVSGTVSGNYTVFVDQSSGNGTGNIYVEDDIRYKNNPLTNPSSTDMLGLVCSNNVNIVDNAANRTNCNIDATIFAYKGGLGIENTNMPVSGAVKVFGGLIEYQAQVLNKKNNAGNIINGYRQRIIFDERLLTMSPNNFPVTDTFEIVSWLE